MIMERRDVDLRRKIRIQRRGDKNEGILSKNKVEGDKNNEEKGKNTNADKNENLVR